MCGIVGYLGGNHFCNEIETDNILKKMSDQIYNRGPDSSGTWVDLKNKIGFAHRRLAILELSGSGHQPMKSTSGRYVLTYNGEIYNHLELRKDLNKINPLLSWNGASDTETLLACFDEWGIKDTISNLSGMFAMAVWDKELNQLSLIRDRLGEKPLYYGWQGDGANKTFIFGSELKPLKNHPQFENNIDRNSLALYMRYNYVPAPHSIYENIMKLEPGMLATITLASGSLLKEKYWDALSVAKEGLKNPFQGNEDSATDELEKILKKSISQQMLSDVPLGAFLSGGVDSSLVVALMQEESTRPVKSFTIGFDEEEFNEAEYAKKVANHIGTEHTDLYVSSKQALDIIPDLPKFYSEPFSDSSQIPTYLVSSLARKDVTVSLSGDGGDELFCGYNRYIFTSKLWKSIKSSPLALRKSLARNVNKIPNNWINNSFSALNRITPKIFNAIQLGDKFQKGINVLDSENINELYKRLISNWHDPSSIVINGVEGKTIFSKDDYSLDEFNVIQKMMYIDSVTYLPDDILTKVDRAAMAVSLETRVPFLDHKVVEFSWRLPDSMKLKNGVGKWLLREVLYRHVPRELIERPKMGFGVPIGLWLKGPLKDWAEELLDETRLHSDGLFHPSLVRKMWNEHLSGVRNWQSQLWAVLMFQAWLEDNS